MSGFINTSCISSSLYFSRARRASPLRANWLAGFGFAALCNAAIAADALVTPAVAGVVKAGTPIEFIKDGFKGTEGPIALPDGSFAFTETQDNRITRIAADGTTSAFLENTNGSNGLGFNARGELISVQVLQPRVGVVYPAEKAKTLVDNFEGVPFLRPNDLVIDKKGGVYFTDSGQGRNADGTPSNVPPRPAVYYISSAGTLQRLANDIGRPNGIQLSPDEKTLYVANTVGEYVLAFDVAGDGSIGKRRDFARLAGFNPAAENGPSSGADGLAVDGNGRLYVASTAGIQIFDDKGSALGVIPLPKAPQNLAFAGPDKKTLYIVGRGSAWRIATDAEGYKGRAK